VDRKLRLRVCGEPVVRKGEVVEARRRGRIDALGRELDRCDTMAINRDEAGRERAGQYQANR
jgi:hypothetical protein